MKPETLALEIIKEQSLIVGESIARKRAEDTGVLKFNSSNINDISLTTQDSASAIDNLIKSYEELFGQASVEVCVEVLKRHPANEVVNFVPEYLKQRLAA